MNARKYILTQRTNNVLMMLTACNLLTVSIGIVLALYTDGAIMALAAVTVIQWCVTLVVIFAITMALVMERNESAAPADEITVGPS